MNSRAIYWLSVVMLTSVFTIQADAQNKREQQVRQDKLKMSADDSWYYDDFEAGIEQARKTGKPLMVVLRCIP